MKHLPLIALLRTNKKALRFSTVLLALSFCSAFFFLLVELSVLLIQISPNGRPILSLDDAPSTQTAIVLGASIKSPLEPSDALYDRLSTARDLYKAGKVRRILLTGDGGAFKSNEIVVMKKVLVDEGIPASALLIDTEGFRTYESCKRAKTVFHIQEALVVTQRFHLARALFLCNHFGIRVSGIAADRQRYKDRFLFALRELGASVKATMDIYVYTPKPPV